MSRMYGFYELWPGHEDDEYKVVIGGEYYRHVRLIVGTFSGTGATRTFNGQAYDINSDIDGHVFGGKVIARIDINWLANRYFSVTDPVTGQGEWKTSDPLDRYVFAGTAREGMTHDAIQRFCKHHKFEYALTISCLLY
jgi:hypothetical protein